NGGTNTSTISATHVVLANSSNVTFNVAAGASNGIDLDVSGSFTTESGVAGFGLIKSGAGVMRLDSANTYIGSTNIQAGTLRMAGSGTLASVSSVSLADATGATWDLNNVNQTIASLTGGGTNGGNVTLGSANLTMGGDNTNTTYGGVISGAGSFAK